MRGPRFQFDPREVKVTPEEILADLRYPAGAGQGDGRKLERARRRPRR